MPIVNPALNRRCLTYNGLINPSPKNLPCWLVGRASLCLCFMVLLWPKSIPFKMWLREHMRSVIYQRRFESLLRYLSLKMFLGICYAFIPVRRLSAYNLCHSIVPLKFNLLSLPIKFNQLSLGEILRQILHPLQMVQVQVVFYVNILISAFKYCLNLHISQPLRQKCWYIWTKCWFFGPSPSQEIFLRLEFITKMSQKIFSLFYSASL